MRASVSTMETFHPSKPAWQMWCVSFIFCQTASPLLGRQSDLFNVCSGVRPPYFRLAVVPRQSGVFTACWGRSPSTSCDCSLVWRRFRVIQRYTAPHCGWLRCRKAELVTAVLMKAYHHTSANTTYSISLTQLTGIKRVWPLLSQFMSQVFGTVCIFGQNLIANYNTTKLMLFRIHYTSSRFIIEK